MTNPLLSLILLILTALTTVQSRSLIKLNSSDHLLVSDGIDVNNDRDYDFLSSSLSSSATTCLHMYGFFPCADNAHGYVFQIALYQGLLVFGEKLVAAGSKRLFRLVGTGVFGASVFRVLTVFPGIFMVVVSGVLTTKEDAQQQVPLGIAVNAGSTIFSLTLLWGMCVIFGRKALSQNSNSKRKQAMDSCFIAKQELAHLHDSGVTTDERTSHTAGIMLLSLIPFLIAQLLNFFKTPSWSRPMTLVAFLASTFALFSYFMYQILDPWLQERSLEYLKYENLLKGFMGYVEKYAKGKLFTEEGEPNIPVIKSLFSQTDGDSNRSISHSELEALMRHIQYGKVKPVDKEYAVKEAIKVFDVNKDGRITETEFIEGCIKWINEAKEIPENGDVSSTKILNQTIKEWVDERKEELSKIEILMPRVLKHININIKTLRAENIVTDDGHPNIDRIKRLFQQYDLDNSNSISKDELKELVLDINFSEIPLNPEEVADEMMKEFDEDRDTEINEQEFINGFTKWINAATRIAVTSRQPVDDSNNNLWKEVDSIVYEVEQRGRRMSSMLMSWSFEKSLLQVFSGIAILTFLGGPLIVSTQQLSDGMAVPPFFITFVIIPVAMNARMAVSTVFPASRKNLKTASLMFSEIYGGVVMNNIMGLSTLLAIVYTKDLAWDYSAEVLIIMVVCTIMGFLAFFRSTYPLWTSFLAFSLYPLSLLLFYVLRYVLGWQ